MHTTTPEGDPEMTTPLCPAEWVEYHEQRVAYWQCRELETRGRISRARLEALAELHEAMRSVRYWARRRDAE
jgi:hypothetical protein